MTEVWQDRFALRVLGMGSALPDDPVTTAALLELIERRFAVRVSRRGFAVARRLGIDTRHICRPFDHALEPPRAGQRNPELAAQAVRQALVEAGLRVQQLSYLISHTATPATALPGNVTEVASLLRYPGPYAEFRQACTGFVNGLVFAQALLRAGSGPVAIVGSETGSVHFDPRRVAYDPGQLVNLVQMGDGAAAIVLARDEAGAGPQLSHVFHGQLGLDKRSGLRIPHGGSDAPVVPHGFTEFSHDFAVVREVGPGLLLRGAATAAAAGITAPDWILPHQANGRMDELLERLIGAERRRVVVHGRQVGNTGSAAIWLGLEAHRAAMRGGETLLALGAEATGHMFGGFQYRHG